jgi:hypothetical protein
VGLVLVVVNGLAVFGKRDGEGEGGRWCGGVGVGVSCFGWGVGT